MCYGERRGRETTARRELSISQRGERQFAAFSGNDLRRDRHLVFALQVHQLLDDDLGGRVEPVPLDRATVPDAPAAQGPDGGAGVTAAGGADRLAACVPGLERVPADADSLGGLADAGREECHYGDLF